MADGVMCRISFPNHTQVSKIQAISFKTYMFSCINCNRYTRCNVNVYIYIFIGIYTTCLLHTYDLLCVHLKTYLSSNPTIPQIYLPPVPPLPASVPHLLSANGWTCSHHRCLCRNSSDGPDGFISFGQLNLILLTLYIACC